MSDKPKAKVHPSTQLTVMPEWWVKLTMGGQMDYLTRHPRSRFKKASVQNTIADISDEEKGKVVKHVNNLVSKELPKQAKEKFSEEAVADIPAKKKKPIADLLRKAASSNTAKAATFGLLATARLCAAVGFVALTGTALTAMGVPIGMFVPHLAPTVWDFVKGVSADSSSDDDLVNAFGMKMREHLTKNKPTNAQINESLVTLNTDNGVEAKDKGAA